MSTKKKIENNGFDSREKYEKACKLVRTALDALTDSIMLCFEKDRDTIEIYAGHNEYNLKLTLNLFDGLFSVYKEKANGEENDEWDELNWYGKADLDIIRRIDLIEDELVGLVYLDEGLEKGED